MLSNKLKAIDALRPFVVIAMSTIAATCLVACGSDNDTKQELAVTTDAMISFKAMFGDEPYICGQTYSDIGTQASSFTAKDFRLYVSNISATLDDNSEQNLNVLEDGIWQHDGVALLDFGHSCAVTTDNPTNTQIEGSLNLTASQHVSQVCFDVGVPFEINHEDNTLQASPLNDSGMFWAWQAGHKFFRLDGTTTAGGFNVHLGSTGCESASKTQGPTTVCANPNRPRICLAIDPATQTIIVDAKALLASTDISQNTINTAPGCMSGNNDPECQTIVPKFGLDFMYAPSADEKILKPAQEQSVFYVQ